MNQQKKKFLDLLYKEACVTGLEYGIDPYILLAQAAHETGWLRSVRGNNLYGIKANSSWKGETVDFTTHEVVKGVSRPFVLRFRAYPRFRDSMEDYCKLISTATRYVAAWVNRDNAADYFEEIAKAGYATDPAYSVKLQSIYRSIKEAVDEYRDIPKSTDI